MIKRFSIIFIVVFGAISILSKDKMCYSEEGKVAKVKETVISSIDEIFVEPNNGDDIQKAIDRLPKIGGTVRIPPGSYNITNTINLTKAADKAGRYIRIIGSGLATKIYGDTKGQPVFDLTGSRLIHMSEFWLTGISCDVGILLARNASGNNASLNRFTNILCDGPYTKATVYSCASEMNSFIGCTFQNSAPNACAFVFTGSNFLEIKSPYVPICQGQSNSGVQFMNCYIWAAGKGTKGLYLKNATDISYFGGFIASTGGDSTAIYLDGKPYVKQVRFESVRIEGERGKYCLYSEGQVQSVSIRGGYWVAGDGEVIRCESAWGWKIEDLSLRSYAPPSWVKEVCAMRFGSLVNSRIIGVADTHFFKWKSGQVGVGELVPNEGGIPLVITGVCKGNEITLASMKDLRLDCVPEQTTLIALNEKRRYLGMTTGDEFLNLVATDTKVIQNPKRGDIALDDGTNTETKKIGLAVYDGEIWIYMN